MINWSGEGLTEVASLSLWNRYYGRGGSGSHEIRTFFQDVGHTVLLFCHLQLRISIWELEEILGKSGRDASRRAILRFAQLYSSDESTALQTLLEAVSATASYAPNPTGPGLSNSVGCTQDLSTLLAPYSTIYVFLVYALMYACVLSITSDQKIRLLEALQRQQEAHDLTEGESFLIATLESPQESEKAAKAILQRGARVLSRIGNWGCSTNLALMLHWRSCL